MQTLLEEEVETRESAGEHDSCRKLIKLMARAGEVWNWLWGLVRFRVWVEMLGFC